MRVHDIAEVLLDEQSRYKYDNTPEGQRLNDAVLRASLSKLDIEVVKEMAATPPPPPPRFDFFGVGHRTGDALLAQQWYHLLISNSYLTRYRGRVRLVLWSEDKPGFNLSQEVLMVPRTWEPSTFSASFLLTRVMGGAIG